MVGAGLYVNAGFINEKIEMYDFYIRILTQMLLLSCLQDFSMF